MALERTLSIIKPDAVAKNVVGEIYSRFEKNGLKVVAAKMTQLSKQEAEGFYAVHRERPFFGALVNFMISGPVMIQVLEGENAVTKNRDLMGATNPKDAAPGTIRADFADSIDANAVHGSDSLENAAIEVSAKSDMTIINVNKVNEKGEPVAGGQPAVILLQGTNKGALDQSMDKRKLEPGNYLLSVVAEGKTASVLFKVE